MKKKVAGLVAVLSVAGVATAVFFSTNVNGNAGEVTLDRLVKVNTANAECVDRGSLNNGKCLTLSQICVGDPWSNACLF